MKKILVLVFAAAILAAPRAQAQDSMMFNHMALGVTLGVDGLGLDLAFPLGNTIQLRGGYGIDAYGSLIPVTANLDLGTIEGRNLNNIPVSAKVWSSTTRPCTQCRPFAARVMRQSSSTTIPKRSLRTTPLRTSCISSP